MNFLRITNMDDIRIRKSLIEYHSSFPHHEQRELKSQTTIMADNDYHFLLAFDGSEEIGAILYWENENFIYVEHFFIYSNFRRHQYGSRILNEISAQGKIVILEIDPPQDTVSIRRKSFYENNGFCVNLYTHIHPPYHKGNGGHMLTVMSYPRAITVSEYKSFKCYLEMRVMGC